MKKLLFSTALMAVLGASAYGQSAFIPKFGLSIANQAYDEKADYQKASTGFVGGVGVNLPLSSDGFVSVQPELLLVQKGVQFRYNSNNYAKYTYNYVEIPVLFKINFGSDAVKAYVNGGPSMGIAAGGREKYRGKMSNDFFEYNYEGDRRVKFSDGGEEDDVAYYDPEDFNRLDLGFQFGGGVGLPVGPGDVIFDVRYGLGLTNFRSYEDASDDWNKSQNRVFALTFGYAIPFGK